MKKYSLINIKYDFREGDIITFDMPPFCSGDYTAKVYKSPEHGLFIFGDGGYFQGCRDFSVKRSKKALKNKGSKFNSKYTTE